MSTPKYRLSAALLAFGAVALASKASRAQNALESVSESVPSFERREGLAPFSPPQTDDLSVRAGSFQLRPALGVSTGYDSNPLALTHARGSPLLSAGVGISANSDWTRDRLGAQLSVAHSALTDIPSQKQTNVIFAVGGGYLIGRQELEMGYTHLNLNETAATIGALPTTAPVQFSVDQVRASYLFNFGQFTITPNIEYSIYRFGDAVILGVPSDQSYQNSNVLIGGAAFGYGLTDRTRLVAVLQGIRTDFITPIQSGQSSNSAVALAGVDDQVRGTLHYRLLIGEEIRAFRSAAFKTRSSPVARGELVWTPTRLTKVTGTLTRRIEDPAQANSGGLTFTTAQIQVDHEYRRNVILQARTGINLGNYLQGGQTQRQYFAAVSATWKMTRNLSWVASYSLTRQDANASVLSISDSGVQGIATGRFTRSVAVLGLRVGL